MNNVNRSEKGRTAGTCNLEIETKERPTLVCLPSSCCCILQSLVIQTYQISVADVPNDSNNLLESLQDNASSNNPNCPNPLGSERSVPQGDPANPLKTPPFREAQPCVEDTPFAKNIDGEKNAVLGKIKLHTFKKMFENQAESFSEWFR